MISSTCSNTQLPSLFWKAFKGRSQHELAGIR